MSTLGHALATVELEMVKVFNDGDINDAKETIRECLMATHTKRVGRDEGGKIIYEEVPDYPIRLAAGIKILEYAVGRPVSRTIQANVNAPPVANDKKAGEDLLQLLLQAPEEAAAIVAKLKDAAQKAKKAEPINVTATEQLPPPEKPSV